MPHQVAWIYGGDCFTPEHYTDGIAQTTRLDSAESIAGHQLMQDLRWRYHYYYRTGDPSQGMTFQNGKVAMDAYFGTRFTAYAALPDLRWGVAALPGKTSNKNTNYNDFYMLSSQSKNPEAAWAFLKNASSVETQVKYLQLTGTPPTNRGAMEHWYRRLEHLVPRADLEKVTQGSADPKRAVEAPSHILIEYPNFDTYYIKEVRTPILNNEGSPKEIIARAKPGYDAMVKATYDEWKSRLPS
jgi:ABC-type glycerol-3-phosphate transport system substrate-binding protein